MQAMSHLKIEEKKSKSYGDPYSEEFDVGAGFQVFVECWGDCLKPLVRQIDDGPKAVKRTVRLKKKEKKEIKTSDCSLPSIANIRLSLVGILDAPSPLGKQAATVQCYP